MKIHFEKADLNHKEAIFSWLSQPYIQEFWDNTQGHKDDILNFMNGRKEPSPYADGKYVYWVAKENDHPFALIMTIQESLDEDIDEIKLANLSKTGTSYGMDYMIGDKNYFGKGLGATTLSQFLDYFRSQIDPKADTFLIDPATNNPRAKHVYMKAGFEHIADFMMTGTVSGAGKPHHLLVKRFQPTYSLFEKVLSQGLNLKHLKELTEKVDMVTSHDTSPDNVAIDIQIIDPSLAEKLCRTLAAGLPEWFGIPEANERYAKGCTERTSLAVKLDDNYIGMITLEFPFPNNANIYWMAVNKKYQGQNIGSQLLKAAEKYCVENGFKTITVETLSPKQKDPHYLQTYRFYEKNKFKPLFELNPYGPELLMCYMIKPI